MSNSAFSNQLDTPTDAYSHYEQWLVQLLVDAKLKGKRDEVEALAQRFKHQPHTLKLVAAYLKRWHASRLSGLALIPGFTDCKDDAASLVPVLNAFENKLYGTSDITLLYLLSLSDRPVSQENMKSVFRSTFMERWLTRRDDYVRFLGPLGRLSEENWHWVIENLRRLQLVEPALTGQHDLLFVAAPIRQHFSNNLRALSPYTFEQASADMDKLFKDTVVEFRQRYRKTPAIKTWISPELQDSLEQAEREEIEHEKASLWKPDEIDTAQDQLSALRGSLNTLKMQAERLQQQLIEDKESASLHAEMAEEPITIKTTTSKGASRLQ